MRASAFVVLALLGLGNAALAASPEEAYRAADKSLSDEFDGSDYEAEAPSPTLKAYWLSVDSVLSERGADGFVALAGSNEFLTVKTLTLPGGDQLVAVAREQLGHLAVLSHGKVLWSSSVDPAAPGCWNGGDGRPCFPDETGLLPAEAGGTPRFYVQAGYSQVAGGTRGNQLSVWRWKDGKAEAVYTTDFATGGDAAQGANLAGDELDVIGKGFWKNFSVCGACSGRQMQHRLRVTPTGIEDLGLVSLYSELDAVDDLLGRLAANQATTDLATPEAAALLKKSWHGNLFAMDPKVGDHMACIAPDDNPALTFRFATDSKTIKIIAIVPGRCS